MTPQTVDGSRRRRFKANSRGWYAFYRAWRFARRFGRYTGLILIDPTTLYLSINADGRHELNAFS